MENLREWVSKVDGIGVISEVRPDVFRCTGQWLLKEVVDEGRLINSEYGEIAPRISKICGEITMTQQKYESEFDDFQKAKSGVTCLEEAVEDVMWETYSLATSLSLIHI